MELYIIKALLSRSFCLSTEDIQDPMIRIVLLLLLLICPLITPFTAGAEVSPNGGSTNEPPLYVPSQILVKFREDKRKAALQRYRQRQGIGFMRHFRSIDVDQLRLPEGLTVKQALGVFRSDPAVIYAEPNYYYSATAMPSGDLFGLLWGLHNSGQPVDETAGTPDADIDAPEAWEITTGSGGVVVAVIDSGLDFSHPDLVGNVWGNAGELPGNGLDDDGNGYIDDVRGWDFVSEDNAPLANDTSGHGTHVSGTIATFNILIEERT